MSNDNMSKLCCASCGIAEVDDIKLTECADCGLVKYCSDACKQDHRPKHKEECKKRAAELRDELLFKLPESTNRGDCPICCLPLPLDLRKSTMMACCSQVICKGCSYANQIREINEKLVERCPFCRKPAPSTLEERDKMTMKRIEANDPVAMRKWGRGKYDKGDYSSAFEWYIRAAELGDAEAHCQLAAMYHNGRGVEKDKGIEIYHLEEAAIGGHPLARHILGCHEWKNDNKEKAVKHLTIAASQGDNQSIKLLMSAFKIGLISKENLAAALRAHHAAVDATKSPQREAAEAYDRIEDNSNTEDC
eukprot:scaffold11147_cov79-Skeletonema_dohrnii-CCMP3373.AAC.4